MMCGRRFISPLLSPDIELEARLTNTLVTILLALSIANQLDRGTLFRKKFHIKISHKQKSPQNSTFGLDPSTDNFLLFCSKNPQIVDKSMNLAILVVKKKPY